MRRVVTIVPLLLALACSDPVHEAAVEALGPEAPGVEPGPEHRPGQPCLLCHGEDEEPRFAFAGTVYAGPDDRTPVPGATVQVIGANLRSATVRTNCAGNFYALAEEFDVVFPATTTVSLTTDAVMKTVMHRSADCNGCHRGAPGPDSPGPVWVAPESTPGQCFRRP